MEPEGTAAGDTAGLELEIRRKLSGMDPGERAYLLMKYYMHSLDARRARGREMPPKLRRAFIEWLRSPEYKGAKDVALERLRREDAAARE